MGAATTAKTARIAILSAAFLCAWKPPAAPAADAPTAARPTWTKLEPANGEPISEQVPITFCAFFRPGEFAGQRPITVVADGRPLPAQVDVKRTFDDGSVKHAIVSLVLPKLDAAGLSLNCQAADSGPRKAADVAGTAKRLLATDFDATVTLTFPGGRSVTASARDMLQADDGKATTWLCGPVAVEWLLTGSLVDNAGHADPDMAMQFQVRYQVGVHPRSGPRARAGLRGLPGHRRPVLPRGNLFLCELCAVVLQPRLSRRHLQRRPNAGQGLGIAPGPHGGADRPGCRPGERVLHPARRQDLRTPPQVHGIARGAPAGDRVIGVTSKHKDWRLLAKTDRADEVPDASTIWISCTLEGKGTAWFDDLELVACDRKNLPEDFETRFGPSNLPAEFSVLARRIGTWDTQTTIKPGVRITDGLKSTGVETVEWVLGKKLIQSKHQQQPWNVEALSLLAYDTQFDVFRSWYFDSTGNLPRGELTGQWDEEAKTLTFKGTEPEEVTVTTILRFVSPDRTELQGVWRDKTGGIVMEMEQTATRRK